MKAKVVKFTVALLCMAATCGGMVRADDEDVRIKKLEDAVQQIRQENQALKQAQAQTNNPVAMTNTAPLMSPGAKDKKMVVGGYVQANAEFSKVDAYRGSLPGVNGANGGNDRFRLRRARLGMWGDLNDDFDYKIMGDFDQGDGINTGNGGSRTAFSAKSREGCSP